MTTGPSSSQPPYLVGTTGNVTFTSILSVGDDLGLRPDGVANRMVGIPDGLGAFDNGDGTFTVLMNHELGATQGIEREHGSIGSFVSRLVIDKDTLQVLSAEDLAKDVFLFDDATGAYTAETTTAWGRFCSGDLPVQSAFFDAATGKGTTELIYMNGEELGGNGRAFAHVVTGTEAGDSFELPQMGIMGFENVLANPFSGDKTVVIGTDDSTPGQVYVYVGDKQTTGNAIEKAGLTNGQLFGIRVPAFADETVATTVAAAGTAFTLAALGDVSAKTGAELQADSEAAGITEFLRPEDGAWDPTHPGRFYFVTTASFDGPSRLWSLDFKDPTDPTQGGKIKMLLDGTEGQHMFDNMTVNSDGHVIIQEDPGNQAYIARIWDYNPATDTLTELAHHDPARFGTPTTQDEESSGVIDVSHILGTPYKDVYLVDVQAHSFDTDAETIEDGQLLAMVVDKTKFGTGANDTMSGGADEEAFSSGNGNDFVRGGGGHDLIDGGDGNDTLWGDHKNDTINGGNGNDTMVGGQGNDQLTGDGDADTFTFYGTHVVGAETDTVTDLDFGQGDRLSLVHYAAGTFEGVAGGNHLHILNGGSSTILNSSADLVEVVNASAAVAASQEGATDALLLAITDGDGDIQTIRLLDTWADYVAAGGI